MTGRKWFAVFSIDTAASTIITKISIGPRSLQLHLIRRSRLALPTLGNPRAAPARIALPDLLRNGAVRAVDGPSEK